MNADSYYALLFQSLDRILRTWTDYQLSQPQLQWCQSQINKFIKNLLSCWRQSRRTRLIQTGPTDPIPATPHSSCRHWWLICTHKFSRLTLISSEHCGHYSIYTILVSVMPHQLIYPNLQYLRLSVIIDLKNATQSYSDSEVPNTMFNLHYSSMLAKGRETHTQPNQN